MKTKDKSKLTELVLEFNEQKKIEGEAAKKKEKAKEQINALATIYKGEVVDGELVVCDSTGLQVGTLKEVANKAKIRLIDGSEPSKLQMEVLLGKLDDRYTTRGINVSNLFEDREDKAVVKVLKLMKMEVTQDTRFDIKA